MRFLITGKSRDSGKEDGCTIEAPSEAAAMTAAMERGLIVSRVTPLPAVEARPAPQRVQIVAGVWTIALGVVLANALIVAILLVLAFAFGVLDSFARH